MSEKWCEFDKAVEALEENIRQHDDLNYCYNADADALVLAHCVLNLLAKLPHCYGPSYDWQSKILEFSTPSYPTGIIYEGELPEVTLDAVTCAEFISWRKAQ